MSDDIVQKVSDLLVDHQRTENSGCICGGVSLGRSHCDHVAQVLHDAGFLNTGNTARSNLEVEIVYRFGQPSQATIKNDGVVIFRGESYDNRLPF